MPVRISFYGDDRDIIWRATLGTIVHKNKGKLADEEGRNDFVAKVIETLADLSKTSLSDPKAELDVVDVEVLHEIIEMLSLVNETR